MASVAQITANRSNAQKSTGPRTAEGKATASHNALKHGLLAEQVVIHGEDPAEFDLYRDGMLEELAPEGAVETTLAERAVSLAWRLRRAERLQSAVFATVYRENAGDVVLWPKHGLPIEPKPDEEAVILGQVVMTDFARAQVLDRLLVHERRIESSLYRTMAELRREKETRVAAEASHSQGNPAVDREVNKVNQVNEVLTPRSKGGLAVDREPAIPAELASFGESASEEAARNGSDFLHQTSPIALEEKITPHGVTTNEEGCGRRAAADFAGPCPGGSDKRSLRSLSMASPQGKDHRQTGLSMPRGVEEGPLSTSRILAPMPCETNPIAAEAPSVKCRVSSEKAPVSGDSSDFTLET